MADVTITSSGSIPGAWSLPWMAAVQTDLTALATELNSFNNLLSTNNTWTGTNTFTGGVTISTGAAVISSGLTLSGGTNNLTGAAASDLTRNVVTGQIHSWKVNNTAEMTLSATTLDLQSNAITTTGNISGALGSYSAGVKFATSGNGDDTIDWYEVNGTFTPAFAFDTAGTSSFGTYVAQTGFFTRTGNVVYFSINIQAGTFSLGTGSGNLNITGLPYTSRAAGNACVMGFQWANIAAPTGTVTGTAEIAANNTTIQFYGSSVASGSRLTWATATGGFTFNTNGLIRLEGFYFV